MEHERTGSQNGKQEFWRQHIRQWEQSGLSQKAYCEDKALCLSVFGYWKRKFGRADKIVPRSPRFYPLAVTAPVVSAQVAAAGMYVQLKNDRFRIELKPGFSPELLRDIVLALEQM